jgi:hypothetical protein
MKWYNDQWVTVTDTIFAWPASKPPLASWSPSSSVLLPTDALLTLLKHAIHTTIWHCSGLTDTPNTHHSLALFWPYWHAHVIQPADLSSSISVDAERTRTCPAATRTVVMGYINDLILGVILWVACVRRALVMATHVRCGLVMATTTATVENITLKENLSRACPRWAIA